MSIRRGREAETMALVAAEDLNIKKALGETTKKRRLIVFNLTVQ